MATSDQGQADREPGSSFLEELKQGRPAGWQRFLQLYGPLVYSWCRTRWHLAPADAADVLQEVALRVLESIAGFRGGNFVAWLWAVTRSRVANHLQHRPERAVGGSDFRERLAEVADHRASPGMAESANAEEGPPGLDHLGGVLSRALERVRGRAAVASFEAFWQVTVQGRAPIDVARDLGLSVNAVYIANSRILSRLRVELGTPEGESR